MRTRLPGEGEALDLAAGEGRNAVWLASRGLSVTALDLSEVALEKAQRLAKEWEVEIKTEQLDLAEWVPEEAHYDMICATFLHLPPPLRVKIHRSMLRAVKPGGVIIIEAFRMEQLAFQSGGPQDPLLLYSLGTLREDFMEGGVMELLQESLTTLAEGEGHQGKAATVRMVLRRN